MENFFNAGGELAYSLSLREMTALCETITGNRIPIVCTPENRPADVRIFLTDHERLTTFSDWKPRRDVKAVLVNTWNWIRTKEDVVRSTLGA